MQISSPVCSIVSSKAVQCDLALFLGAKRLHQNGARHLMSAAHLCCQRRLQARPGVAIGAQRRGRDDYVELDDDYVQSNEGFNLDFLPATSGRVLRTLQTLTDRFVDIIYDLFPVGTSRSVVETTTKGGILLVTLAFASSILTFLLNAGFVVLGLYIATKVFNVDIRGLRGNTSNTDSTTDGRGSGSPPRRSQPRRRFKTDAGQAASDLTDVWFERKPKKQK